MASIATMISTAKKVSFERDAPLHAKAVVAWATGDAPSLQADEKAARGGADLVPTAPMSIEGSAGTIFTRPAMGSLRSSVARHSRRG